MLDLADVDIKSHSELFFQQVSKGSKSPLMFDDFVGNVLDLFYKDVPFPEQVRIAPPMEEMLRGNFEPSQIVEMEPPEIDGHPIWRGSTLTGFVLRGAGYVNGDRRSPCSTAVDDNIPHGLLAGATGHGKSVTLNALINMGALEYAPWEAQYKLVDACDTRLILFYREMME